MKRDRGDILLMVIPLIAALGFLATVIVLYVTAGRSVLSEIAETHAMASAMAEIGSIIDKIAEDPTPEADSTYDGVARMDGSATLIDLSGACLAHQKEAIDPKRASSTPGYLNPFLASDAALVHAAEMRTGNVTGINSLKTELRAISAGDGGRRLVANAVKRHSGHLFPIISAAAPINVNYADEESIKGALAECGTDAEKAGLLAADLAALRGAGEILPTVLAEREAFREIPARARMALGTKTWFWEIRLRKDEREYKALVCAIPDDECRTARSMAMLSFARMR